MQAERINFLLTEVKNYPNDPFNYYALALEYSKRELDNAKFYFEKLLKEFPEYHATYLTAANFYWAIEDLEKAKRVFAKGILLAENGSKAEKELKSAYALFIDEIDE